MGIRNIKVAKSKKIVFVLTCIALLSLGFLVSLVDATEDKETKLAEPSLPLVEVKDLKPTDIKEVLNTIGFFVPENDLRVTPDTVGTVERILVSEGDKVKRGDLLFQLENSSHKERVNEAQRDLDEARNKLQKAQQEESWSLQMAKDNLDEAKEYEQEKKMSLRKLKRIMKKEK